MQETKVTRIALAYGRHQELVDGVHLFSGSITLYEGEELIVARTFKDYKFHNMITDVSRYLRESEPGAAVTLLRNERAGARPLLLDEELRRLIRDDPVRAIRAMTVEVGSAVASSGRPEPSVYNAVAELFGERVYIRMKNGTFEDPNTGTWRTIAYAPKRFAAVSGGWFIRGERDSVASWLPVRLPELEGLAVEVSEGMEAVGLELAKCQWATASVEDILKQNSNRYFLPRRWNSSGQWITRTELRTLLDTYLQRKEQES